MSSHAWAQHRGSRHWPPFTEPRTPMIRSGFPVVSMAPHRSHVIGYQSSPRLTVGRAAPSPGLSLRCSLGTLAPCLPSLPLPCSESPSLPYAFICSSWRGTPWPSSQSPATSRERPFCPCVLRDPAGGDGLGGDGGGGVGCAAGLRSGRDRRRGACREASGWIGPAVASWSGGREARGGGPSLQHGRKTSTGGLRVLQVPSWYPPKNCSLAGTFIREQGTANQTCR